jgi:hypothetical protein
MLHRVVHVSDISTADGRSLDHAFLAGIEFPGQRNDYVWPVKHHVTQSDYTSWRKAMEYVFSAPNLQLIEPLGEWTLDNMDDWTDQWDWFVTSNTEFFSLAWIIEHGIGIWHRLLAQPRSHRLSSPPEELLK